MTIFTCNLRALFLLHLISAQVVSFCGSLKWFSRLFPSSSSSFVSFQHQTHLSTHVVLSTQVKGTYNVSIDLNTSFDLNGQNEVAFYSSQNPIRRGKLSTTAFDKIIRSNPNSVTTDMILQFSRGSLVSILVQKLSKKNIRENQQDGINLLKLLKDKLSSDLFKSLFVKLVKELAIVRNFESFTVLVTEFESYFDAQMYTISINLLLRFHKFKEAYDLFESARTKWNDKVDSTMYLSSIRAAGHVIPWKEFLDLLNDITNKLDNIHVIECLHYAISNFKHNKYPNSLLQQVSTKDFVSRTFQLLQFAMDRKLNITSQLMDASLAVICTHGNYQDIERLLDLMTNLKIPKSAYTLNTLLNRWTKENEINRAMNIMKEFNSHLIYNPDITTYNTLLKICLHSNSTNKALEILNRIKTSNITINDYTKVLKLKYHVLVNIDDAISYIDLEPDHSVTNYMFSVMISAVSFSNLSHNVIREVVLRLLDRAITLQLADEAIYTATAQTLSSIQDYEMAMNVIDKMRQNSIPWNKMSVSITINLLLNWMINGIHLSSSQSLYIDNDSERRRMILSKLHGVLVDIQLHHPDLITNAVCQKVLSGLCNNNEAFVASQLQLSIFHNCTCKSEVLDSLFTEMQSHCEDHIHSNSNINSNTNSNTNINSNDTMSVSGIYAQRALAIIGLYRKDTHIHKLRISHFNAVLRMLTSTKRFHEVKKLFQFISSYQIKDIDKISNTTSLWKPTTFTIAELIRAARESKDMDFAHDVIVWATKHKLTFIPLAVISDAVSFVYNQGRIDLAYSMYENLYVSGKVNPWRNNQDYIDSSDEKIIDLHNYSKGMAYAAVVSAINKIRAGYVKTCDWNQKYSNDVTIPLVVITGQSLKQSKLFSDMDKSYLLVGELQNILIEDIYPPLSSSTVPGNPGRLIIHCPVGDGNNNNNNNNNRDNNNNKYRKIY